MNLTIPEYKPLFELTKRRLRGLKKIANKEFGEG